jgi:integrase
MRSTLTTGPKIRDHLYERPDDPLQLVPYSLRHTFKDRAETAMDSRYVQYILGHKTKDSSAVHQRYGTNAPPSALVVGMADIQGLREWGMFEEFD